MTTECSQTVQQQMSRVNVCWLRRTYDYTWFSACCLAVGLALRSDLVSVWMMFMHTYFYYFLLSLSHSR